MTRVYEIDKGFNVHMDDVGWFFVNTATESISRPSFSDRYWLEAVLWGLPTSLILLDKGFVVFHASAVEIDGRAILFAAPGGHGKTTLSGALMAAGHRLLSEDLIRCGFGREFHIFPGPALIRLRRDVAARMTIPGTRRATEDPEKIHLEIDLDLRGDGRPVPLGGLVFLHRGETLRLERADEDLLGDLWAVTLNLPTTEGRARCFEQITAIAASVPIWRLTRPLTWEALPSVIEIVQELPT